MALRALDAAAHLTLCLEMPLFLLHTERVTYPTMCCLLLLLLPNLCCGCSTTLVVGTVLPASTAVPDMMPLALLTPNSRRQQLKKILSWQKYQNDAEVQNIASNSNVPKMPEDDGNICEHIVTCRCDWLDWSCLCSWIMILVGFIIVMVELGAERQESQVYTYGMVLVFLPIGMWALCVGVPFIAFNTTLGRSRW
jgi:hypothetical protein